MRSTCISEKEGEAVRIHLLQYGRPLCGFPSGVPLNWPAGHLWVGVEDKNKVTCPGCKEEADAKEGKQERSGTVTEQQVLAILGRVGAVMINDHFVLTGDWHSSGYVNKDAVYPHTADISRLCQALAEPFSILEYPVEVVIGPAIGGVILSQRTADHLSAIQGNQVLSVYAEKEGYGFVIKRDYDKLVAGKIVLIVEDVITTGGSAKKVIEAVRAAGGIVVGLSVLCNRGGVTPADVGDPPRLNALINLKLETYEPSTCPLCAQGIPINTDVGKGREFLAQKQV